LGFYLLLVQQAEMVLSDSYVSIRDMDERTEEFFN
jgi:hypothetical protein